jgi:hypothetical protein
METAVRMGIKKAPKRKRLPEERGLTERSIGVAKGKCHCIHNDPYAGGERSGKHAKPDALSTVANAHACTCAPPSGVPAFSHPPTSQPLLPTVPMPTFGQAPSFTHSPSFMDAYAHAHAHAHASWPPPSTFHHTHAHAHAHASWPPPSAFQPPPAFMHAPPFVNAPTSQPLLPAMGGFVHTPALQPPSACVHAPSFVHALTSQLPPATANARSHTRAPPFTMGPAGATFQ